MTNSKDRIYSQQQRSQGNFKFDERVARVFEDMISRSVPGYQQILAMLPSLVRQFHMPGLRYYDIGCSLGAGMLAIANTLNSIERISSESPSAVIGIDNSGPMLIQARRNLDAVEFSNFELREQDAVTSDIDSAVLVLMNFTLQFIPLAERAGLIAKIAQGLVAGGALVLSEKLHFDEPSIDQLLTEVHHQYKAGQGYSRLEISQKRDAIENVLIPETLETHVARLKEAGFSTVTPWVQNLQFVSILAIK